MNILVIIGGAAIAIIFLWFITRNKILLFWFGFIAVFLPFEYIDRYFLSLPSIITWLPYLLLVGCSGLTVVLYRKAKQRVPVHLIWLYILFLTIALFSMFYNETSIGEFIYAQRGFIFVICMIIVFKTIYTKYTLDDIYTFIVKGGLLLAGLALFERVVFVTMLRIDSGDMITGTFSTDTQYTMYQLVCTVIVIAYWLNGKQLISLSPKNTLLIFIGSIAIANSKAGILFIIVILGFFVFQVGYKMLFHHLGKMVYLLFFIFLGVYTFEYFYTTFYGDSNRAANFAYLTDIDYVEDYLFGEDNAEGKFSKSGSLKRGAAITFTYDLIKQDPFTLLLGMGPGSTLMKQDNTGGYLNNKYPGYNIGRTTFSWLLCETGILGLGIYFCMLLSIFFWNVPQGRKEHKIIKNTIVLLLFLYAPYANNIMVLSNALIIAIIIFPNLEHYFTKAKESDANSISKNELQPSPYFTVPTIR